MLRLRFEWDEQKNRSNRQKHGISFEEARTSFFDEYGLLIEDPDHSNGEERFIFMGMSAAMRFLVVCHCYREAGDVVRIISARKATAQEHATYRQRWIR